jgi:hypothetical protein
MAARHPAWSSRHDGTMSSLQQPLLHIRSPMLPCSTGIVSNERRGLPPGIIDDGRPHYRGSSGDVVPQ